MAGEYSFNCLQCGSPIPVHALGQSLSYACRSCGALVEENHQGLRILQQASQRMLWKPLLELGSKAQFRGETWQVLGFMVRSDGTEEYYWSEYLLYNPYQGFRWLTESQGHWNFIHMTRHRPTSGLGTTITWGGHRYRLFLKGRARVQFVLGEFYWRVKIGDEVEVRDYIAPPDILSCEEDGQEEMWSAGTYVEAEDVQKSFKIKGPMPAQKGVASNQPSRFLQKRNAYLMHWVLFSALLVALHFLLNMGRQGRMLVDTNLVRHPKVPVEMLRSETFAIDQDNSNVKIRFYAPLHNSWINLRSTLIGEDGQLPVPIDFRRELVHFRDDYDGSTESNTFEEVFLSRLKKGRYHLEIVTEAGWEASSSIKDQDLLVRLTVLDNVRVISPLVLCLVLVSLYPLWILLGDWRFETKRWADSDMG